MAAEYRTALPDEKELAADIERTQVMLQGRKRITLTSSDVVQMEKNTKKAKKKSPRKQRQEKGRNEGKK